MRKNSQLDKDRENNNTLNNLCNFQQLFKLKMIKRLRKQQKVQHSLIATIENHSSAQKLSECSQKMIKFVQNIPKKLKRIELSSQSCRNISNLVIKTQTSEANHLQQKSHFVYQNNFSQRKTIYNKTSRHLDSFWKIKQFNKQFDKQKVSMLKQHKSKNKRENMRTLPSKLMCMSISPLSQQYFTKNSLNSRQYNSSINKTSSRYVDIPISQFIYDNQYNRERLINKGLEVRLQQLCRRKNSKIVHKISLQNHGRM